MCAHDLEQVLVKYVFKICSRLTKQCCNIYLMHCAIWYQSLFGVCMEVRAYANAC